MTTALAYELMRVLPADERRLLLEKLDELGKVAEQDRDEGRNRCEKSAAQEE